MFKQMRRFATDWAVVELEMTKEPVVKLPHNNQWASVLGFNG